MSVQGHRQTISIRQSADQQPLRSRAEVWEELGRRWKLIKLLHQGETSRVYAARPTLSSPYREARHVVKVLRRGLQTNRDAVAAMAREVLVAGQIRNPSVISVVESQLHAPPYYIAFNRIKGVSLAARLEQAGPFAIPAALGVTRQVADALTALHSVGWLHGDIKPANILLSAEGEVTLIDLAFARRIEAGVLDERRSRDEHRVEPLAGTLAYLPPEATLRCDLLTPAADLYSLGATLFELLTGRTPFAEAKTAQQLLLRHREVRPPDVREFRADVPTAVAQLVQCLLAKNPVRRPFSAAELAERIVPLEIETFGQWA